MLTEHELLARAQAGDERAFGALTEPHRRELQAHCYRMLGSTLDAEDMVQETLLAAWRGLERFQRRSSVRAWLYRIATNRCLNALRDNSRRPDISRRVTSPEAHFPEPTRWGEPSWLEPYPDALLETVPERSAGPAERYETRESLELAYVAALQHLPARQRAALLLRDVLGFRASEAAEILQTSEDSVTSALKRARAGLEAQLPGERDRAPRPDSPRERELVERFAIAFQAGDIDTIVALLTDDAKLTMPPLPLEYEGRDAAAEFLKVVSFRGDRVHRLIPTRANTQPAFGCYLKDPQTGVARAHGLLVVTLREHQISAITRFIDNSLMAPFGLPRNLRE